MARIRGTTTSAALVTALISFLGPAERVDARDIPRTHTVQAGDVLGTIAEEVGVSVDELRQWNELSDDTIRIGQELRVAPRPETAQHTVVPGETLTAIAVRAGASVQDLLELNPGLEPDRIHPGQQLEVPEGALEPSGTLVEHTVRRGDTLSALASYHHVDVRDIVRWNPGLNPNRIRVGSHLRIDSQRPPSRSESIGFPYRGRLRQGVQLPRHPAYVIRDRSEAWGTDETIASIVAAFDRLHRNNPRAPRVRIHDISDRDGGWLSGHKSHQSGRDADIAYLRRRCPDNVCGFAPTSTAQLDVADQWTALVLGLENDQVEAIFIDYKLQAALYQHARKKGATREQLHRWFQYPRGRTYPLGAIRHYPKHHDHMHVRFVCHDSDRECH